MTDLAGSDELRLLNPAVTGRLGHIRHALFDFDGTLSLIREGWANVMIAFMLKSLCGEAPPPPGLEQTVRDYVDQSTGTLTILQMKWLEQAVAQATFGAPQRTAAEYKAGYVQQLLDAIRSRRDALAQGTVPRETFMVPGGQAFLTGLAQRGVTLYLASGTDYTYVYEESHTLGLGEMFGAHIYGAQGVSEVDQKAAVIQHLLSDAGLSGAELLVVGDGPVEIREGLRNGAITLGVASDETRRARWDERKVHRLTAAGADLLVPDFAHAERLLSFLFPGANHAPSAHA
jgi:phosphoglycolate phosphatase